MRCLADLYDLHAKECREAAERIDNPVHRLILLQMERDWLRDAAALRRSTQATSPSTDAPAPSENRAA
jgi:hypothetical protein